MKHSEFYKLGFDNTFKNLFARKGEMGLGIGIDPYELGIYSKKTNEDFRGPAYLHNVVPAITTGAGALGGGAALSSALTGKSTAGNIKTLLADPSKFLSELGEHRKSLSSVADFSRGRDIKSILKSIDPRALGQVGKKVIKNVMPAGLLGAGLFGAGKLLSNVGQYETGRAVTEE